MDQEANLVGSSASFQISCLACCVTQL
jgi:hypothetical protein